MENKMYTIIAMIDKNPESMVSLGTFWTREEAEAELQKNWKQRKEVAKEYYYAKVVFNYLNNINMLL